MSRPKIHEIVETACRLADTVGVTPNTVMMGARNIAVVRVRWRIILAILKLRPDLSSVRVGMALRRDHSTVLFAADKEEKRIAADPAEAEAFRALMDSFDQPAPASFTADERLDAIELAAQELLAQARALRRDVARERAPAATADLS